MWLALIRAFQKDNWGKGLPAIAYLWPWDSCNVSTRWRMPWHCTKGWIRTCRVRCRNQRLHVSSWSLQAPSTSSLSYDHFQHSTRNTDILIDAKTHIYLIFCIVFYVSWCLKPSFSHKILILHLTGLSFVEFIQEHYIFNDEGFPVFK